MVVKTRDRRSRGQYVLTLATEDGVLVDCWKVHDGLFGPGDEDSTDVSEGRLAGKQALLLEILEAIVAFNGQQAQGPREATR